MPRSVVAIQKLSCELRAGSAGVGPDLSAIDCLSLDSAVRIFRWQIVGGAVQVYDGARNRSVNECENVILQVVQVASPRVAVACNLVRTQEAR